MIKRSFRSKLLVFYVLSVMFAMIAMIIASNYIFRPMLILNTRDSMVAYSELITEKYGEGSTTLKRTPTSALPTLTVAS